MTNYVETFPSENVIEVAFDATTNTIELIEASTGIEIASTGVQGAAGASLISGDVNPPTNDLGILGDYYFYTLEPYYIYGPKTESGWPSTPFFQATGLTRRHVHTQSVSSSTWDITHTLGGRPSVTVVDSAKSVVVGDVTYIDDSNIRIEFNGAFTGSAYLT